VKNLTIVVACYNTPKLVLNLLSSIQNECETLPQVMVMNTSNNSIDELIFQAEGIPYFNFKGGIHGEAVNLAMSKVKTKYALLIDSDVIIKKDFLPAFDKFKESGCALMGKVVGDCGGKSLYPRVEPWFCFMDMEALKRHKIKFFDSERTLKAKDSDRRYDIGSTMFEDVEKAGLSIADANMEGKYFKHYGGMSWRVQSYDPSQEDTDIDFGGTHPNKALHDYGLKIAQEYDKETTHLGSINIMNAFSNE